MIEVKNLPWLPDRPNDFKSRVRGLVGHRAFGTEAQVLARHRLKVSDLRSLSRAITRQLAEERDFAPLSAFRLAVLSNTTFDFVADILPASAARHGVALELFLAPLDQVEQQALNPASETFAFKPDAVLLGLDQRWLGFEAFYSDKQSADQALELAIDRLETVAEGLVQNGAGFPIFCTIPEPKASIFGSFDARYEGSAASLIRRFNLRVVVLAAEYNAHLFDQAGLAATIGLAEWHDDQVFDLYKIPFNTTAVPLFGDWLGRLLGSFRGKMAKCLVLDLDNTCWGGAIGDEGLEGIILGPGTAQGEAFVRVQELALALKQRGIVLAVCSKNNDENARLPFREHPDMLLKEKDIAVFQANWSDKPSNIEAIAQALNIGVDTLVLLDDNGAERAQVRAALPQVCVPELPSDASLYADILMASGHFEASGFSSEDSDRAESYAKNALRVEVQKKSRNLGDYLSALEMVISHQAFDRMGRTRIAQLINKSNQFNLTTRRYSESEVEEFERDRAVFTLQTRLEDRFGSFGMIGVVIAKPDQNHSQSWRVDTWLMSCRVLGRRVEEAMMAQMVQAARNAGIETIYAEYFPTAKNNMVSDHFDKLGFRLISEEDTGHKSYAFEVGTFEELDLPFELGSMEGKPA